MGNRKLFKSGFVSVIGRTNVGKSTFINSLIGEKIAATANKPQTTRTAIRGIINRENSQIIFIDTPGIHKPKTKLSETMIETAWGTISEVDLLIFVIEATSSEIGKGDRLILDKIKESDKKAILIINKIDLVKRESLLNLIDLYSKEYKFEAVFPIIANKNKNKEEIIEEIEKHLKEGPAYYDIEEYTDQTSRQLAEEIIREKALKFLKIYNDEYEFKAVVPISATKEDGVEAVIAEMVKLLPEGPKYYSDEEYTDQTVRQISEEIIREKALKFLNDEVPHGIYVEVDKMKFRKTKEKEQICDIEATIYCLRDSHKGIIIGKNGEMLKRIGTASRYDLEKMLDSKINLKTWVKVNKDWQEDTKLLKRFKFN